MKRTTTEEKPHVALRRAAMDYLARREHSFHELVVKLSDKFPDYDKEAEILPVLGRLQEENLQSDERFTESYVRYRGNRGHGPLKIEAELVQKGVESWLIREFLYAEEHDWTKSAREALLKKYGTTSPETPRDKQRYYRFLAQRGFGSDEIAQALAAE